MNNQIQFLEQLLHDIYEVWAGMEGVELKTPVEHYLMMQIIENEGFSKPDETTNGGRMTNIIGAIACVVVIIIILLSMGLYVDYASEKFRKKLDEEG